MAFTMRLEEPLADQLRQEASAEQTTVEELGHRLMREALQHHVAVKRWRSQNQRRLELISKKRDASLSDDEQREFDQLQAVAYEMAAPFDRALRQTVEDLRQEIESLPMASPP